MRRLLLLLLLFLIPVAGASTNLPWAFNGYSELSEINESGTGTYNYANPLNASVAITNTTFHASVPDTGACIVKLGTGEFQENYLSNYQFNTPDFKSYTNYPLTGTFSAGIQYFAMECTDFSFVSNVTWSQNVTLESESYANNMVYMNISFTPNENITYGTIEAEYSIIDFSVNGYVGALNVLLDDVNVTANASMVDETVTLAVQDLNNSAHWINISVIYNKEPTLIAPADDSVHNYSYPPMTHLINLSSEQVCVYTRFQVWQGNVLKYSTQVAGNETSVYLPSGDYMWSAESYSAELGTYSSYDTRNFTINDLLSHPVNATGVYGVIYEDLAGMDTAVESALVTVYNTTWSDEMLTDEYGYYEFYNLTNDTYYIAVSKDRYDTPAVKYVTLTNNNMSLMNIYIERNTGDYYARHDVEFIVKSLLGTRYENVEVTVYISGSSNIYDVDETDSTGSVVFPLEEDTEYYITFIDATQGINDNIYLYPIKDSYNIYVTKDSIPTWTNTSLQDIEFIISTTEINATTANITVQYVDYQNNTTSGTIYLNQTNVSDFANQTMLDSQAVIGNTTFNFTVTGYSGEAYYINGVIVHGDHGDIDRTYSVQFDGMVEDYGFANIWKWIGIGVPLFVAACFNAKNVNVGGLVTVALIWIFLFLGFYDNFGSGIVTAIKAGATISTVFVVMKMMAEGRRVDV